MIYVFTKYPVANKPEENIDWSKCSEDFTKLTEGFDVLKLTIIKFQPYI